MQPIDIGDDISFFLPRRSSSIGWDVIKAQCRELLRGERVDWTSDLYKGMRKDDARSSCRTLRVRIRRWNCVRVGPVRCYFTGSNCRHKHSKHSQAGRAAPGFDLNRYDTHSPHTSLGTFSLFYFISAHQQECLITTFALSLFATDRSVGRSRLKAASLGWVWNEFSTPFGLSHQRGLDFTDR